jgi:hypothetical protein
MSFLAVAEVVLEQPILGSYFSEYQAFSMPRSGFEKAAKCVWWEKKRLI